MDISIVKMSPYQEESDSWRPLITWDIFFCAKQDSSHLPYVSFSHFPTTCPYALAQKPQIPSSPI